MMGGSTVTIDLHENGLYLKIYVDADKQTYLLNLSPKELVKPETFKWHRLVELQCSGFSQNDHHGAKHTGTQPGSLLRYARHVIEKNAYGTLLRLTQQGCGLEVTSCLQFYNGIPVVQSWTELQNLSEIEQPLEYISSFALTGLTLQEPGPRDENGLIHIPHSTWKGEAQWKTYPLHALGYDAVETFSMKRIALSSTGAWSGKEYLPMGAYENLKAKTTLAWQIETTGSWAWEISDIAEQLYLQVSGPTYAENGFMQWIKPGESFTSVPCTHAYVNGDFTAAIQALTQYRRRIRRPNRDNAQPSVIFNDYMNCLMGDPTTERELPLIDAAAEIGCRYYCIDCGWYDDGPWWDGVGEWLPAKGRFPGGLEQLLRRIREKGMLPGLWLELEVMGIDCPLAKKVPKDWFFQRNGRPVIDHNRYQLDFRNPDVIAHANMVVDRLVQQYGVAYIKMDYNIEPGVGTDLHADSAGAGLLAHTRAYLAWLDDVFARYPELIIENCSSGGMRMCGPMLSRQSIQSVTDQEDYVKTAAIACNCMTAVPPEQAAIWSYPQESADAETVVFNMVNAILFRIHQSGHIARLSQIGKELVKEGIQLHLSIVDELKTGLPVWPLGLASFSDDCHCVGIQCQSGRIYLAVWNLTRTTEIRIPLKMQVSDAQCIYPKMAADNVRMDTQTRELCLRMKPGTARIFRLSAVE